MEFVSELLHKKLSKLCDDYYPQCKLRVFNQFAVLIWDPEDIEVEKIIFNIKLQLCFFQNGSIQNALMF